MRRLSALTCVPLLAVGGVLVSGVGAVAAESSLPSFSAAGAAFYDYDNGAGTTLVRVVDTGSEIVTQEVGSSTAGYTAVAFRESDRYLYGFSATNNDLVRIGANGQTEVVAPLTAPASEGLNLPSRIPAIAAEFGADGFLYASFEIPGSARRLLFRVNADTGVAENVPLVAPADPTFLDITFTQDYVAAQGYLWGVDSGDGDVLRYAAEGSPREITATESPAFTAATSNHVAGWRYPNGDIAFVSAATGQVERARIDDPSTSALTSVSRLPLNLPISASSDGASAEAVPTDLAIAIDAPATVPGGTGTVTVTVTNNGPWASSGATVSVTLPFPGATAPAGCTIDGVTATCTLERTESGASVPFVFTLPIPSTAPATAPITATVTGTDTDPNEPNNTATTALTITPTTPTQGGGSSTPSATLAESGYNPAPGLTLGGLLASVGLALFVSRRKTRLGVMSKDIVSATRP